MILWSVVFAARLRYEPRPNLLHPVSCQVDSVNHSSVDDHCLFKRLFLPDQGPEYRMHVLSLLSTAVKIIHLTVLLQFRQGSVHSASIPSPCEQDRPTRGELLLNSSPVDAHFMFCGLYFFRLDNF